MPSKPINSASHEYQFYLLTNDKADKPAEICIEEGSPGAVFLDVTKAFDTV